MKNTAFIVYCAGFVVWLFGAIAETYLRELDLRFSEAPIANIAVIEVVSMGAFVVLAITAVVVAALGNVARQIIASVLVIAGALLNLSPYLIFPLMIADAGGTFFQFFMNLVGGVLQMLSILAWVSAWVCARAMPGVYYAVAAGAAILLAIIRWVLMAGIGVASVALTISPFVMFMFSILLNTLLQVAVLVFFEVMWRRAKVRTVQAGQPPYVPAGYPPPGFGSSHDQSQYSQRGGYPGEQTQPGGYPGGQTQPGGYPGGQTQPDVLQGAPATGNVQPSQQEDHPRFAPPPPGDPR